MLSHARLSILSNVVRNYSATTAAESTAAESATTAVESTTGAASSTVSTAAVESTVDSLLAALLPQDAKDTAANATNKNTNFSFSLLFKICNTYVVFLKRCKDIDFFNTLFSLGHFFSKKYVLKYFSS